MNDDTNLTQALQNGDEAEVQRLVDEAVSAELSEEEQGRVLVGFVEAYMNVANEAGEEYLAKLEEAATQLEVLSTEQVKEDEGDRLEAVRGKLGLGETE